MTRAEILRHARQSGIGPDVNFSHPEPYHEALIERFARRIAAAQSERCAKSCEALVAHHPRLDRARLAYNDPVSGETEAEIAMAARCADVCRALA